MQTTNHILSKEGILTTFSIAKKVSAKDVKKLRDRLKSAKIDASKLSVNVPEFFEEIDYRQVIEWKFSQAKVVKGDDYESISWNENTGVIMHKVPGLSFYKIKKFFSTLGVNIEIVL